MGQMSANPLGLTRLHHIPLMVGNAKQAAHYYQSAFGFSLFAYAGLETGERHHASYALRQGKIVLIVEAPLGADEPEEKFLRDHGDGVRDVAFEVHDVDRAFDEAVRRGALPVEPPHTRSDVHGSVRQAAADGYRFKSLVQGVISSDAFRKREGDGGAPASTTTASNRAGGL